MEGTNEVGNRVEEEEERLVPPRVWSGAALLSAGRLWASLCTASILVLLARHLRGAEFGRYTFYLALFLLLDCLADFGTATAAVQRSGGEARLLGGAIAAAARIRRATTTACYLLVVALALAMPAAERPWVLLAGLYCFSRIPEASSVIYHGEIRWGVPVAVRMSTATLRFLVAFVLWRAGARTFGPFLLAHVGVLSLGNAVLYLCTRRRLRALLASCGDALTPVHGLLTTAAPLGVAAFFQQAYFYVDNLFVRGLRGEVELGRYNAAVRIMGLLVMMAPHATTAALPWLARRHRAGELSGAARRLVRPLFLGAAVVLGLLWPWCGTLLATLFGPEFAAAAPSLRWLLAATVVIYAGSGWLTALVAAGRMQAVLALTGAALLFNLAGNAWLVPVRGMEGAAMATTATELLVAGGALLLLRRTETPEPRPAP